MAVLTTKARKRLAPSKFALPGGRFPIENKAHAADAKARATQGLAKGTLTPAEAATVRHKADVVLGETDSTYHNK
jgi:hypothetical protein